MSRSRWTPGDWVAFILVPLVVVFGILAPVYVAQEAEEEHRMTDCAVFQANHDQLVALESISIELGIPVRFEVPEVPASCAAYLP